MDEDSRMGSLGENWKVRRCFDNTDDVKEKVEFQTVWMEMLASREGEELWRNSAVCGSIMLVEGERREEKKRCKSGFK